MSKINIDRVVGNIRGNTTVYSPVIETIVNAVQAIEQTKRQDGRVLVSLVRSNEFDLGEGQPAIVGFKIQDNGIGFDDKHRDSFDTLYTDTKVTEGGKGFGRFIGLKYFEDIHFKSVFKRNDEYWSREFTMGRKNDIIINENTVRSATHETGTVVTLSNLRGRSAYDKRIQTVARHLVERLLPYFISEKWDCPKIILLEHESGSEVCLNDYVAQGPCSDIQEVQPTTSFTLMAHEEQAVFVVRVFKFYSPGNQKSRISLVAHKREVLGSTLDRYIPEFEDEFYDSSSQGENDRGRNYIIKAYVSGSYLDSHVMFERSGFEFQPEKDTLYGIAQAEIERKASEIALTAMGNEIKMRREKKQARVQSYVDEQAPWHKKLLANTDLTSMPYRPTDEQIELLLQRERLVQNLAIRGDVEKILVAGGVGKLQDRVQEIVSKIADSSMSELTHYIALRRAILDLLGKSLESDETSKYSSEGVVHDIIFPRKGDTERTPLEQQNLWLVDERLNFATYVSSDIPLFGKGTERPDLIAYDKRVLFRGDNEPSNPITIFEFKRPQRDDFANRSSKEDPIAQVVRYVMDIRSGKYKTPEGRPIRVEQNTPFYGYVVCDLTSKVTSWIEYEKNFKPLPDRQGWYQWMDNLNLYMEAISWDKILADARMRNRVFFQKLGI